MLTRWLSGAMIGTLVIAATSPIFVRSYLPREINRGVWALSAGQSYRWRSEGYATTSIGPHGMPGKTTTRSHEDARRVALWGDSQAEGVCVADEQKIFALAQSASQNRLCVFPLAQSGDRANDWIGQMEWSEQQLGVTDHVFLIAELSDLQMNQPASPTPSPWTQWASSHLPAFVIASIRNLATDDGDMPRKLRFRPGPVRSSIRSADDVQSTAVSGADRSECLRALRRKAVGSITIIYAPKLPQVVDGKVKSIDGEDSDFGQLVQSAIDSNISVIDLRDEMRHSAARNQWPHGFHNGQIGSGHLNVVGNQIIAHAIADRLR